MKKLIFTAIVSFILGAALSLVTLPVIISSMLTDVWGSDGEAEVQVSLSTDGVSWDTPANKESVILLYNNLPESVKQMCRREYASKVANGTNPIKLKYPEGELYFDWEQQTFQICSEGVNLTVEGIDKAFCDELFLGK